MARSSPDRSSRGGKADRPQHVQVEKPAPLSSGTTLEPAPVLPPPDTAKERGGWRFAMWFWLAGFLLLLLFELFFFLTQLARQVF